MSQLKVNCPFCQKELLIQNEHLGSQMTCPICGGTFFVPAPQSQQAGYQQQYQQPQPPYQQPGFQQTVYQQQYQQPQTPYQQSGYQQTGMGESVNMFTALKKYADFTGRARRLEYWLFYLLNMLIQGALYILAPIFAASGSAEMAVVCYILLILWGLAIFIPALAVAVRRLHDSGRSGVFVLTILIPCVGGLIFLIIMCLDSQPGPNMYGPNPKERYY